MDVLKPVRRFHGGLRLPANTSAATREPILRPPRPGHLVLPLRQHAGADPEPLVYAGQRVARGQPLARATAFVSAALHAPASGTVRGIERHPVAHPSGLSADCIVLELDAEDRDWDGLEPVADWSELDPSELRNRVREAGVVGLGGAAFPSHVKLTPGSHSPVRTLILNGAECEPYISCDEMLMRERPRHIVEGARIMLHALKADECIIALEEDDAGAIQAMRDALTGGIRLAAVPSVYPQGGERQLIEVLTGRKVPRGKLPLDIGIVCHNVATAAAVSDAILDARPLVSRIVTVAGDGVLRPRNVEALFGTPFSHLIEACGGYTGEVRRLVMGGPMMGFAVANDGVPVVKSTNCIIAAGPREVHEPGEVMPCIRCGACAEVCPAELLPQQLYWHTRAKDHERVEAHDLFDCIECGCCDLVCPSHIPLVDHFRFAKAEIWHRETERDKAELARRRYEARRERIEAEREARERRRAKPGNADIESMIEKVKSRVRDKGAD